MKSRLSFSQGPLFSSSLCREKGRGSQPKRLARRQTTHEPFHYLFRSSLLDRCLLPAPDSGRWATDRRQDANDPIVPFSLPSQFHLLLFLFFTCAHNKKKQKIINPQCGQTKEDSDVSNDFPVPIVLFQQLFFFDDSVNFLSSETKNVHMNQHPFHYLFDLLENLTNALLPNCACKETRAHSAVSRFTVLESSIAPVLIIERDGHFLITILTWFFSSYISEKEKNNVLLLLCECVHRVQTDTLGASVSTKKKKKLNSILHDFS